MSDNIQQPEEFIPDNMSAPPPRVVAPPEPLRSTVFRGLAIFSAALALMCGFFVWKQGEYGYGYGWKGQGWDYISVDVELSAPLSWEMRAYQDSEFHETLSHMGGQGWELVSALQSPRKIEKGAHSYRLLFKRPGAARPVPEPGTEPRHDRERAEKAIAAESQARAKIFEAEIEAIRSVR